MNEHPELNSPDTKNVSEENNSVPTGIQENNDIPVNSDNDIRSESALEITVEINEVVNNQETDPDPVNPAPSADNTEAHSVSDVPETIKKKIRQKKVTITKEQEGQEEIQNIASPNDISEIQTGTDSIETKKKKPRQKKEASPAKEAEQEEVKSIASSDDNSETQTVSDPSETKIKKTRQKKEAASEKEENQDESPDKHGISADEEIEHEESHAIDYSALSKIELLDKLEELVKSNEISQIKSEISAIKVASLNLFKEEKQAQLDLFISNGGSPEDYTPDHDPLEERFNIAFQIYKENKIRDNQEQEKIKIQNLELKKQILEEIKILINSEESLKKTYDDFRELQDKWKQTGMVPRNEIDGLWNNYHFLVEKFFEKVKINNELKDLDLKKNLEAKIDLCEKAEELLLEKSITKSFKLLQKYHEEWKEIGPVIQDKKDEIWERFKTVSDKINQQRREYYENLRKDEESNLLAKTAICEKIDEINTLELNTPNEWNDSTNQIHEMQKLWDSIGRAPAKVNDEIWNRFRTSINKFFDGKKVFFGEIKDQQVNNYNLKLDLCAQAEGLANSNNWKQATKDILKLQQDWKIIGPVPRRHSDKIWKRFRTACDNFFTNKTAYFSNIHTFEKENLQKKKELLERVNSYQACDDKKENLENLKNFQREWVEIGFIPIEIKEKLQNEFKKAIDNLMDKLNLSFTEVNAANYKNRIENIQKSPDSKNALYKERIFLEGKLSKLTGEILQLENNLGFFASSKKADLLKVEFEKKIQDAKQEQALLEAKLKLLKRQE